MPGALSAARPAGLPECALSVVVPTWRDDERVPDLPVRAAGDGGGVEWIVAAVEPAAATRERAARRDFLLVECAEPSRGRQMNAGAARASGGMLCFHHADSELTAAHCRALLAAADDPELIGGAFERKFDHRHPLACRFERCVNAVNRRFGPFFGDQSIFVRAPVFRRLGGFADIPLMEDLEFSRRLRRAGRTTLLGPPLATSARRFRRLGSLRCSLLNGLLICAYYLGVPPRRLHAWYYGT